MRARTWRRRWYAWSWQIDHQIRIGVVEPVFVDVMNFSQPREVLPERLLGNKNVFVYTPALPCLRVSLSLAEAIAIAAGYRPRDVDMAFNETSRLALDCSSRGVGSGGDWSRLAAAAFAE